MKLVAVLVHFHDGCCVKGSNMPCSQHPALSANSSFMPYLGLASGHLPLSSKQTYTNTYPARSSEGKHPGNEGHVKSSCGVRRACGENAQGLIEGVPGRETPVGNSTHITI